MHVTDAELEIFWLLQNDYYFIYPYFRFSINELGYSFPSEYFDVSGPYGYNGPISNTNETSFIKLANSLLIEHFRNTSVVTEFVRYCPITDNSRFHLYPDKRQALNNVFIDISRGADWVWRNSFEARVRKAVNKAATFKLDTILLTGNEVTDTDIQIFLNIYIATMERNEASRYYYFNNEYFRTLFTDMRDRLILAITDYEGVPVSTELLLFDGANAFGFLGGTLKEYYYTNANSFQRWEIIKYLANKGYTRYSLGGGGDNDGIYKYKLSFAKNCTNPFIIGTSIINEGIYKKLLQEWDDQHSQIAWKYSNYFQRYRLDPKHLSSM